MQVSINGERRTVTRTTSLADLLPDARGIAVAVNGAVVRPTDWATTTLSEGDRVEVVSAHQGG